MVSKSKGSPKKVLKQQTFSIRMMVGICWNDDKIFLEFLKLLHRIQLEEIGFWSVILPYTNQLFSRRISPKWSELGFRFVTYSNFVLFVQRPGIFLLAPFLPSNDSVGDHYIDIEVSCLETGL